MDWVQTIATLILGSGGLLGAINFLRTWRARRRGVPADERRARRLTDQTSLNRYWQGELNQARQDRKDELAELKAQVRNLQQALQQQTLSDAERIDQLEEHIWLRLPPPPPLRKRTMRDEQ